MGSPCGNQQNTDCDLADTCDAVGACQVNFATMDTTCGNETDTTCTDPGHLQRRRCMPCPTTPRTRPPCNDDVFCTRDR